MKKSILLILALVLTLFLTACGGKDNTGSETLNREDSTPSSTAETSTPVTNSQLPDLAGLIGGNNKLSNYDVATRQAMIDAAREDGGDLEFKTDGSVVYTDLYGSKVIQNIDGTWTFEDEEGTQGQFGGDWPENEFTRLLPKPDFQLMAATTVDDRFSVAFTGATLEQIKAYVEQVKSNGFTVDADTQDENVMGITIYAYNAKNANGYFIEISFANSVAGLSIEKP